MLYSEIIAVCSQIHSFIPSFSTYPYTDKAMDAEIVKKLKYNIVQNTVLSH